MTSIQKVLISFEEYTRLKDIEKEFEELSKEYQSLKDRLGSSKTDQETHEIQKGSGEVSEELLTRKNLKEIVDLVKQEIVLAPRPVISNWRNFDRAEPTITAIGQPKSAELTRYDVVIEKSDLNDTFDEKKLLKRVPKEKRSQAIELLKDIESRPSELTFDSNGIVFIDETSVPGTNIFKLFPLLFQKQVRKKFTGFDELSSKIIEMGLGHLIQHSSKNRLAKSLDKALASTQKQTDDQWWYLD